MNTSYMNVKDIRRENLRSLAKCIGGITAIANKLGKSQSQISHLIGASPIKNIGDRLASEIEEKFEKARGWLDKEHFRVNDETGIYVISNVAPRVLSWLPLIEWFQINHTMLPEDIEKNIKEFIPVNFEVSTESFALRVQDDIMDAPIGISFPKGTILIVDPSHIPTHSSFVIAYSHAKDNSHPVFKQLIYDGSKRFLKPLNPRYDYESFDEQGNIIGVVRQSLMKLE